MRITYVHHSSFFVKTDNCQLLFDYYKGQIPEIDPGLPLYVMASHAHEDHFADIIFDLIGKGKKTVFILSDDIPSASVPAAYRDGIHSVGTDETLRVTARSGEAEQTIISIAPHARYSDGLISIDTLASNDKGVAFVMELSDGGRPRRIYFAGDLNAWDWNGDEEDRIAIDAYYRELTGLENRHFDTAFIPVDPRLKDKGQQGLTDFFACCGADTVFPMHFWKNYDFLKRVKELPSCASFSDRIRLISAEGDVFDI